MNIMMSQDRKKGISDGIVESILGGKKEYSTKPGQYAESCMLCAQELLSAIDQKDPEKLVSAFIALSMEVSKYTEESYED
jgi:hypothetical protein